MSILHKDEVETLPYSEEGKAYIACQLELEAALTYLLEELEKNNKLDNTVICLSAGHYPYAMEESTYNELSGETVTDSLETYRNNLFSFPYDSGLYAGRDVFSDEPPLVVFSDRSFITDRVSYYKKKKEIEWKDTEDEEYLERIKKEVKKAVCVFCGNSES